MEYLPRPPASPAPRSREAGGLLVVMLFAMIPVAGLVVALSSRQLRETHAYQSRIAEQMATQRALSGIEIGRSLVMNSSYQGGHNDVLLQTSQLTGTSSLRPAPRGPGFTAFNAETGAYEQFFSVSSLPSHIKPFRLLQTIDLVDTETGELDDADEIVHIYAAPVVGLWHVIEAEASYRGVTRTARVFARERDPFSRYAMFINNKSLNLASVPDGPVHCNKDITFFYPNKDFPAFVSAHEGFAYNFGADPSNIIFSGGSSPNADVIGMPSVSDINALGSIASGAFRVGSTHDQTRITFNGDQVTIVARRISNNQHQTLYNGPLPANGVIYSENAITGLAGDIEGRVTVASPAAITITGNLRYVDADNEPAYVNANNTANFAPNPDYTGNSALGIIAGGNLQYGSTLPNNTEIHAACFTGGSMHLPGMSFNSSGNWTGGYQSSFNRATLCFLGATIVNNSAVSAIVNGTTGVHLAGFQSRAWRYDWNLLDNPPPHFLAIDRPMFRGIEIVQDRMGTEVQP